jgi:tetratricopeptide (TPR) repeat protein
MGAPSGGVNRTTSTSDGNSTNSNSNSNSSNNSNNINSSKNCGEFQSSLKPAAFDTLDSNQSTILTTATAASTSEVYISLIQQYIAVFQIDNALFLAERCLADYPDCYEVIYMQALCYYRLHKFKNARACLNAKQHTLLQQQQAHMQQQEYSSTSKLIPESSSSGHMNYSTICSMLYLSAQSSFELGDYPAAETALLQSTRNIYQQQYASSNSSNGLSMDEWIVQSTVRSFFAATTVATCFMS